MDFFERAHVGTREMKPIKEQESKKKQLKVMLQGYKKSDNKLIREAENLSIDESSSVSGFSDLNLTVSSDEENCNTKNIKLDQSLLQSNEMSINNSSSKESGMADDDVIDSITSTSLVNTIEAKNTDSNSISDRDGDMVSFSDISLDSGSSAKNLNSSDASVTGSSLSEFDPTGELALKIREKLTQKNHQERSYKKNKKEVEKENKVDVKSKSVKKEKHIKQKTKISKDSEVYMQYEETVGSPSFVSISASDLQEENIKQKTKISKDSEVYMQYEETVGSPSFVSISASDLQEESFNQVLGDYKYSTIRNLPSDNHSTSITSQFNFPEEIFRDVNVRNIDEVSSLIPEVDDDFSVSDFVEIGTTTPTILENSNLIDTSTTDQIEIESDSGLSPNILQSNYDIFYGKNNCVIVLKHPAELYIHGRVLVSALGGVVEVSGYTLTERECPIIAPLYTYPQCFKTVESNNDYKSLYTKLKQAKLFTSKIKEIVVDIGRSDGILLMEPLKCPKMDFVAQNYGSANLFKNYHKERELERAANFLGCTMYSSRPQKFLYVNPIWERLLPHDGSPTIGIACGGKSSGKSTFLRYYVNKMLHISPILVIDLDPGQCEFTVAGNISATVVDKPIFGPSFTHMRKPSMCLNIGIINSMDNIKRYSNAVKNIMSHSRDSFRNIPWIINTMGMTNTVGLKFMALIISLAQPNFVLQYDSRNHKKCFETSLTSDMVTEILRQYKDESIFSNVETNINDYSLIMAPEEEMLSSNKSSLLPREERYLNFLAYFADLANDLDLERSLLLGVVPYEVKLKDLYIGLNVNLKGDSVMKVINGKVVALCEQTPRCHGPRMFTLADKPLLCHGHGLIRGIDWENEVLYVITPMTAHELSSVNTLLYADWVPELRGQEAHLPEGTLVPYRTKDQQKQSKLMATPKRRFNPLILLKMTRNN